MTTDGAAPELPEPIARFVSAINEGDTDAFVACFADDGYVDDWGRRLEGHDGVRSWADSDAIGMDAHMTILGAEATSVGVTTRFAWASRRFNGESTGIFRVEGDRIASFTIPPAH